MPSFNKFIGMGNIVRDLEKRTTPNGTAVVNFDIAINRNYTTQAGEKRDEVTFLPIVVWGKQAEVCSDYLAKGRLVQVEGHLQQRSWETPEGQKRSKIEVVAEHVIFLGNKPAGAPADAEAEAPAGDDIPF